MSERPVQAWNSHHFVDVLPADSAATKAYVDASVADLKAYVDAVIASHGLRCSATADTLNSAVPNGGMLKFDMISSDSDGFAPTTMPFDTVTIPAGLDGVYLLSAWSSGSGNQSTTLGMGIVHNGTRTFSGTNQSISGPGSVNYTLDNAAVEIGRLYAGDTLSLVNNSVTGGTNQFHSCELSLVRIGPIEAVTPFLSA